jgi:hypothetical protein
MITLICAIVQEDIWTCEIFLCFRICTRLFMLYTCMQMAVAIIVLVQLFRFAVSTPVSC